uniref:Uncharacterized protein n=1 Tax=uncultured Chloroflexota bacterium TaxID=166587 RepID=H5S8Q5_9CHLR|nr:hypothetical protein HGMM_F01E07C13 [uncultured Chloroflexota bacterium]
MNDLFFIPLIFFVGVLLALLVGYLIGRIGKSLTSLSSPQAAPQPPPALLRLFLDEAQRPRLEMNGVLLTPPLTAEERRQLIALLNLIRPWLEGSAEKGSASQPVSPPPPFSAQPAPGKGLAGAPSAAPAGRKAAPAEPSPSASLVAQIDAILQEIIQKRGVQQTVHLSEAEDGGIQVVVGARLYKSIEEVPEQEIQHLIRQAVAVWEKQQG